MKKLMIIILIVAILLTSGCVTSSDLSEPEITPIKFDGKNPGRIDIYFPQKKFLIPPDEYINKWQIYMKDKHNMDINLTYTKEYTSGDVIYGVLPESGVNTGQLKEKIEDGGFIYVGSTSENLIKIIESGLVVPVNDYIYRTPSLAVLDELIPAQYADEDGNIWAIPLRNKIGASWRLYNNEWLEKWGGGVPESIEEYREYAEYVRDNDPDGNGKKDSYIQAYSQKSLMFGFKDIFKAFGCYTDMGVPISYNPVTEKYENALFTDNFVNAISYILNLKDEGLIVENQKEDETFSVASTNGSIKTFKDCSDFTAGFYLTGPNDKKLIRVGFNPMCLFVLEGTENVPEKLEYLLSSLQSDPESRLDFDCGIKEESYHDNGNYYSYYFYEDDNYLVRVPRIGIETAFHSDATELETLVVGVSKKDLDAELAFEDEAIWKQFRQASEDAGKHELAYSLSFLLYNNDVSLLNTKIYNETQEALAAIMGGEKTIEDALIDYKAALAKKYLLDDIEDLNN